MYPTKKEITLSAFVQKIYKFCKEMTNRGHTVYHYGHPDSEVECSKHFDVISLETYEKEFKNQKWQDLLSEKTDTPVHREFNKKAAKAINEISNEDDFVLAFWGHGHRECCEAVKKGIIVEASIGYDSFFAENRVFESYAQLHKINGIKTYPKLTDVVIAPGFEKEDFTFEKDKDDYLLYLGRMTELKGTRIAQQMAQASRTKIKFVGPQIMKNNLDKSCRYSEFINTVSLEERSKLLSKAKALIMPSLYAEPCGWVMIEAFLSGTPVVSTDWGGMSEYNLHGVTGFRCHSANDFFHAISNLHTISSEMCRTYAENFFSIKRMCDQYENYFKMLRDGISKIQPTPNFPCAKFPVFEKKLD